MNNNNLYNNNFIGTTHLDTGKITSNFILATSNILEQRIPLAAHKADHIQQESSVYATAEAAEDETRKIIRTSIRRFRPLH
jgi:hypothetical protein